MRCDIGKHSLGEGQPAFIVAEMSGNHNGSLDQALELVRAAKNAGADAIKLQTYRPDTITLKVDTADFKLPSESPWAADQYLYDLYEKAQTPWEWHQALFDEAARLDLTIFSSPFDASAVDLLERLGCPAYKIASPEITDIPLIRRVAQTGKPVIFSTGVACKADIELAISTLKAAGCEQYIVLKCVSNYPTKHAEMNLSLIPKIRADFNCLVGLSDHSTDHIAPVSAVALGACFIEKHLKLARDTETVDGFFSLDEAAFAQMVDQVRKAEQALGRAEYQLPETVSLSIRRSLYVSRDIAAGERLSAENIQSVRPHHGLAPKHYDEVLGRVANKALRRGERLRLEDLEGL